MILTYLIGALAVCCVIALFLFSQRPEQVLGLFFPTSVAEVLEGFRESVEIATRALPFILKVSDEDYRKYILGIWYWFSYELPSGLTPEHQLAFKEAWLEASPELRAEAGIAYQGLTEPYRDLIVEQISNMLRRKELNVETLKLALCELAHPDCLKD